MAFNRFLNHPAQISNYAMLLPVWSRSLGMAGIQHTFQSEPYKDGPGKGKNHEMHFLTFLTTFSTPLSSHFQVDS